MVRWMKSPLLHRGCLSSGPAVRSSSVGQRGKATPEPLAGKAGGAGPGRSKLQHQAVGGAARGTEVGGAGAGPRPEVLTVFLLDVYQFGDEVLQLGHALAHCGPQRFHPSLLSPGSWRVHVAHVLDRLGFDSRKGQTLPESDLPTAAPTTPTPPCLCYSHSRNGGRGDPSSAQGPTLSHWGPGRGGSQFCRLCCYCCC